MEDRTKYDRRAAEVYRHFSQRFPEDHRGWHAREFEVNRLRKPPEWGNEKFWFDSYRVWKYHFAHISETDPNLIAYTQNDEKGAANIQTKIKPGRYLKQFFGETLSEKEIARFAAMHNSESKPRTPWDDYELKFATDVKNIVRVYKHGPASCMDGRNHPDARNSPVRPYAAGDLAVAYLEGEPPVNQYDKEKTVVARALVWPEKLALGRVYPTPGNEGLDGFRSRADLEACHNALLKKLRALGYKDTNTFDGAKLLKMPRKSHNGGKLDRAVWAPFLDLHYKLNDKGEHLEMSLNGDFHGGNTAGFAVLRHPNDCHHCRKNAPDREMSAVYTHYDPRYEDWSSRYFCRDCTTNHTFMCSGLNAIISDTFPHEEKDGRVYSRVWLDREAAREKELAKRRERDRIYRERIAKEKAAMQEAARIAPQENTLLPCPQTLGNQAALLRNQAALQNALTQMNAAMSTDATWAPVYDAPNPPRYRERWVTMNGTRILVREPG